MTETPWMTVDEASAYTKRHADTIRIDLRNGKLRGSQTKRKGKWIVHREDLDAWMRGDLAPVREPRRRAS